MSVPEGKRNNGSLLVFEKARDLAAYTVQICGNPKSFPPEVSRTILDELIKTPIEIFRKAWEANNINVRENEYTSYDLMERLQLQKDAIRLCTDMIAYIGLAKKIYHLPSRRVKFWNGKVIEVRTMLRAWHESDVKRFNAA